MNDRVCISSVIGPLTLEASDNSLVCIHFKKLKDRGNPKNPHIVKALKQLTEYFQGKRHRFELTLDLNGSEFQLRTWQGLQKIPFGKTWSYQELAQKIGAKNGARAVGMANGKNPLPIIIPCHRVIGANGTLTGYAGGLPIKKALLNLEGHKF